MISITYPTKQVCLITILYLIDACFEILKLFNRIFHFDRRARYCSYLHRSLDKTVWDLFWWPIHFNVKSCCRTEFVRNWQFTLFLTDEWFFFSMRGTFFKHHRIWHYVWWTNCVFRLCLLMSFRRTSNRYSHGRCHSRWHSRRSACSASIKLLKHRSISKVSSLHFLTF